MPLITSSSIDPSLMRRSSPTTSGGTSKRRGGSTFRLMAGNQRSLRMPRILENGVNCAPSMRTGSTVASALSAISPAPS